VFVLLLCAAAAAPAGTCVRVLAADEDVANCVRCHPTLPVLATSGIDSVVKLWSPLVSTQVPAVLSVCYPWVQVLKNTFWVASPSTAATYWLVWVVLATSGIDSVVKLWFPLVSRLVLPLLCHASCIIVMLLQQAACDSSSCDVHLGSQ
jgi:WD40 repeat protein